MVEKLPAYQHVPIHIWKLEVDPRLVNIRVHVQEEMNLSVGIIRDSREAQLGDVFQVNESSQVGPGIKSALEIRWGTITYDLHIQRFEMANPSQKVIALTGNGNLLFNDYFVSWIDGKRYHLRQEPIEERVYPSLVIWRNGRVSIEDLRFWGSEVIKAENDEAITSDIIQCTSGIRLIREGVPVNHGQLAQMALEGRIPDLRHFLRFPALRDGPLWSDIGLEQLTSDRNLLSSALAMTHKVPIEVDVPYKVLKTALEEKGYDLSRGDYELRQGILWLKFRPGLYPHNMIGILPSGNVISILVTGLSNRAGITLEGAAILLNKLGAQNGILVDNGGDVMMQYFGDMAVTSSELGRRELRSVILFTKNYEDLRRQYSEDMGIRLTKYPPY